MNYHINQGAYIYARNTDGKSVIEYLEILLLKNNQIDGVQGILDKLKSKIPSLQSLAAMKAKDLTSPGDIPKRLQVFLDLH